MIVSLQYRSMKLRSTFLLLLFLLVSVPVNGQTPAELLGTIEKDRYANKFFKFEMAIPEAWIVAESEERKAITKIGLEAIKTGDVRADTLIADGAKKEVTLLFVTEKPLGSLDNGALGMSVTKLPVKGYTPTFLTETFKSAMLKNRKNTLVKDVSIQYIGGRPWGDTLLDIDFFGQVVHTNYFVTVIDEFALVVTMSYQNPKHLEKMDAAFRGIKFTDK